MKMTITHQLDHDIVVGLFKLYLYRVKSEGESLTKTAFIEYARTQVEQFGSDETSLLGSLQDYPDLTEVEYHKLVKWGLLE